MKVYNASSYGRLKLMVQPGNSEPANDRWFEVVPGAYGSEPKRVAMTILIQFQDGTADVDDELGRYLLEHAHSVSREPVPFTRPAPDLPRNEWETIYAAAPRKPPMQVGGTMTPEAARSQQRRLGEKIRG